MNSWRDKRCWNFSSWNFKHFVPSQFKFLILFPRIENAVECLEPHLHFKNFRFYLQQFVEFNSWRHLHPHVRIAYTLRDKNESKHLYNKVINGFVYSGRHFRPQSMSLIETPYDRIKFSSCFYSVCRWEIMDTIKISKYM